MSAEPDLLVKARSAAATVARKISPGRPEVRPCSIRLEFIRRDGTSALPPPMSRILRGGFGGRGGRGGDVRLKLYLSLLWHAAAYPFDVPASAYSWAVLLGLQDADGKGKRRVQDAVAWLEANQFVLVARKPGKHPTLRPLREDGSARAYTLPGPEAVAGGAPSYRQLHAAFWLNGWIATLPGSAIAVWLAYVDAKGNSTVDPWLSETVTRDVYGLTDDMRKKGLRELISSGLLERRYARMREPFQQERPITRYRLNPSAFDGAPL